MAEGETTTMPTYVQQELIEQGDTWLQQVPDVQPNTLHTVGVAEGEGFVRTDSEGNALIVGTSLMREGKLTLSNIVSAQPHTEVSRQALREVRDYIRENDIVMPPQSEWSADFRASGIAETTALGAAYAAGFAVGFWDSLGDLHDNWQMDTSWQPMMDSRTKSDLYQSWLKAVERTFNWVD